MRFNHNQEIPMKKDSNKDKAGVDRIYVDMHCHSLFSDGSLSPEQIARELSNSGVEFASLTDHNTIAGGTLFQQALAKYGIGFVSGIEITTEHKNQIIHLLAYGFDAQNYDLITLLNEKITNSDAAALTMPQTFRNASQIIELIHNAGGLVILAHPFQTEPDIKKILILTDELQKLGLDGIEAFYGPNSRDKQKELLEIAANLNLLVSAGTDFHEPNGAEPGIYVDMKYWKPFRDALLSASFNSAQHPAFQTLELPKKQKTHWLAFFINIFLPVILSLALFIIALFALLLPYFEETLIERKRENIRQLTQVAWGVLNEAAEEVDNKQLSLEQAQELAKKRIEAMRYGVDNKDYFWLQDTSPKILMHPYRTDLNDQDVSDYQDAEGTRIFVAFSDLVMEKGEGYISYVWQWMDDPDRQEPKESYIRLFEPWGWVIGTGIYVNDVNAEIAILRGNIVTISLVIIAIVFILLLYLIRQSMLLEKSRIEAEKLLFESTERYHSLSEAASEGALFVYGGRCRYANAVMYELLECTADKIELLELQDIFPDIKANKEWLEFLSTNHESDATRIINGVLKRNSGALLSCKLTVKNGMNDPKSGFMILVRRSDDLAEYIGSHVALNRLLHIPSSIASDLADSIKNAYHLSEVITLSKKTAGLVVTLLENGTSSIAIAYMISLITDIITQKIIELSSNEIGTPPAPFAFLALGSQGRQSQTLFSDQDNAIIYELKEGDNKKELEEYFLKLATMVCDALELAGYKKCIGKKIASNPEWCQPMSVWKSYFSEWIHNSEPQQVVEFSILFDFRTVCGNPELAEELSNCIYSEIQNTPFFLSQIAQNALIFKTPLRLFGNIVTSGGKDHPGRIDVKTPASAIVCFARLYALKNIIKESNTLLQLDAIKSLGIILDSKHRDIVASYETLLRLRLWNQASAVEHNQQLNNWIDPDQLSHLEEVVLIECFKEIDDLQALIQRDFLT
ncbi:MAG: cache domain-containing protein [Clostridiales bacterium]|nr:cache domain-containing protein [Clostridiales bacterium]